MAVKRSAAGRKKGSDTDRLIRWLAAGCFVALTGVSLSVAFISSTSGPSTSGRQSVINLSEPTEEELAGLPQQARQGMRLLRSNDPASRIEGITIVMSVDVTRATSQVLPLLADPFPEVRAHAATMLTSYDVKGAAMQVAVLLSDPDPNVRAAAVAAMSKFGTEPGVLYYLSTPMSSSDPAVVADALSAWMYAAPADRTGAANVIRTALASSDEAVVSQALGAVSQIYQPREWADFSGDLEGIRSRFGDAAPAAQAQQMLASIGG